MGYVSRRRRLHVTLIFEKIADDIALVVPCSASILRGPRSLVCISGQCLCGRNHADDGALCNLDTSSCMLCLN